MGTTVLPAILHLPTHPPSTILPFFTYSLHFFHSSFLFSFFLCLQYLYPYFLFLPLLSSFDALCPPASILYSFINYSHLCFLYQSFCLIIFSPTCYPAPAYPLTLAISFHETSFLHSADSRTFHFHFIFALLIFIPSQPSLPFFFLLLLFFLLIPLIFLLLVLPHILPPPPPCLYFCLHFTPSYSMLLPFLPHLIFCILLTFHYLFSHLLLLTC